MEGSMKLSITRAWDEASVFVKQEAGPLFLIVFALAVLPGLILQAIAGRLIGPSLQMQPGTKPDLAPFVAALPTIFLLLIPVLLLSIWGHLTVNTLALRRETVIGSAFRHAGRRILPLIAAWLLWIVGAAIILVPVVALVGIGVKSGHSGIPILLVIAVWLGFVFVSIRLLLVTPVAAAEPIGPIAILRRSWELTAGHFWKLLGFLCLIALVFFVLAIVVGSVVGILVALIAGLPTPGSLSSFFVQLVTGLLQAVFLAYFMVMIARLYAQLSGNVGSVAQVFD
jgi:hypothetical protein